MAKNQTTEVDSVYFLKILFYLIIGTIWITKGADGSKFLPLGLIGGIIMVQHEKLQIDRKIEYAILLIGSVLGLVGIGINISL